MKWKNNMFFKFWTCFKGWDIFFWSSAYPINTTFSNSTNLLDSCLRSNIFALNYQNGLWSPDLSGEWHTAKNFHPKICMTHQLWSCKVTWQMKYISTCRRSMKTELGKVLTYCESPTLKPTWSFNHMTNMIFSQNLWPLNLVLPWRQGGGSSLTHSSFFSLFPSRRWFCTEWQKLLK